MPRVNLDDFFFNDKRIKRLALLCKEEEFAIRGRLVSLYHDCYTHKTPLRSSLEIDLQTEWIGSEPFAELMAKASLAVAQDDGIYHIKGVSERIEYLLKQSERGRRGGLKSGSTRQASAKQTLKQTPSESNPLDTDTSLSPDPDPDPDLNHPPNKYSIEQKILKAWNYQKITKHEPSQANFKKIRESIKSRQKRERKKQSLENLYAAFLNYSQIVNGPSFFNYKWDLWEFIRGKNADKFFPENFKLQNWEPDQQGTNRKSGLEEMRNRISKEESA